MVNKFRILSIDGGGIRGVFAAQILKRINEEFKINYSDSFDIIIGTSTGSIIAAGLAIGYPIEKILDIYKTEGKQIFYRNYSNLMNWFNWKSFFWPKYNSSTLKDILNKVFQDRTLSQTKTRLIIPSADVSNGNVFVFKSNYDPNFVRDKNTRIVDAVLASCSAPLYFNPHKVNSYLLADGGIWANNPSLIGLTEALGRRFNKTIDEIKILSLGTGIGKKYYDPKDFVKKWGFRQWGLGLVDTIMNLQSLSIDNIVRFIMNDESRFLRINFSTDTELSLDDIGSVESLISRADEMFTYNIEKLSNFIMEEAHVFKKSTDTSN